MTAKTDKVYFPKLLTLALKSLAPKPEPTVRHSHMPTQAEVEAKADAIKDKLIEARIEGFDVGAIVATKYGIRQPSYNPLNWGIVVDTVKWASSLEEHKTLIINWIRPNRPQSKHNIDEVFLVHAAVDESDLESIFNMQEALLKAEKEKQNSC